MGVQVRQKAPSINMNTGPRRALQADVNMCTRNVFRETFKASWLILSYLAPRQTISERRWLLTPDGIFNFAGSASSGPLFRDRGMWGGGQRLASDLK